MGLNKGKAEVDSALVRMKIEDTLKVTFREIAFLIHLYRFYLTSKKWLIPTEPEKIILKNSRKTCALIMDITLN